jgi:uncharacterized protein with FMN-binding domain
MRPSRYDVTEEKAHMKRAPLFVVAGTIAGFAGILSFHTRPGTPSALAGSASHAGGGAHRGSQARAAPAGIPAAPAGGVRTAVGPTEQYGYGQLAVKVTARGNRITNVTVPTIQTAESYSQQLATQVIPTLRSEVLAGQTARINGVSGATYTSQAYAMSVQAALDKLQIR